MGSMHLYTVKETAEKAQKEDKGYEWKEETNKARQMTDRKEAQSFNRRNDSSQVQCWELQLCVKQSTRDGHISLAIHCKHSLIIWP